MSQLNLMVSQLLTYGPRDNLCLAPLLLCFPPLSLRTFSLLTFSSLISSHLTLKMSTFISLCAWSSELVDVIQEILVLLLEGGIRALDSLCRKWLNGTFNKGFFLSSLS